MAKPPPNDGGWNHFGKPLLTSYSGPSQWQSLYSLSPQNPQSNLTTSHWTQAQGGLPGQHSLAPQYMYVNQYINFPQYESNGIPIWRGINEQSNNTNPYQSFNNITRVYENNSHPVPSVDEYQSSLRNSDFGPASGNRSDPSNDVPCAPMGPLASPVNKRVTSSRKNRNTSSKPRTNLPLKNPDGICYAPTAPKPQKRRGRPPKNGSAQKAAPKMKKPRVSQNRKSGSGSRPVASSPPNRPGESLENPIKIHSPERDSQVILKGQTHRSWPPSSAPRAPEPSHLVLLPSQRPSHENCPQVSLVARNCHSQLSTHLPRATKDIQTPTPDSCPKTTQGSRDAHLQQSSSNLGPMKPPPRLVLRIPDRQKCPQIAMNNSYSQPAQQDANPHYQSPAFSSQAPQITQGSIYTSSHQASSSLEGPGELGTHPEIYVPNAQLRPETPRTNPDPYSRQYQIQQQHQFHNYLDLQAPPRIYPGIPQTINLDGIPSPAFPDINQRLSSTKPMHPPLMTETRAPSIPFEMGTPSSTHLPMPITQSPNLARLIEEATNSTPPPNTETTHTKPDQREQVPAVREWPIIIYPNISMFLGLSEELCNPAQDLPQELGLEPPRQSPANDIDDLILEDDSWLRDTKEVEKIVNEWLDVWDSEGLLNRDFFLKI